MKKLSWEIIVAGLFFIAIAFYLLSMPSDYDSDGDKFAGPVPPEAPTPPATPSEELQVINLEGLAALEELEHLKELNKIESLQSLKELAHLIPEQTRAEFLTEINKALREFSDDEISINFDMDDELILVKKEYDIEQGNWGKTSPGVYTYLNEFDASSISDMSVSLPNGSITLIGTSDSKAKLTVQASGEISSAEELKTQYSTAVTFEDGEAVFSLENLNLENSSNVHFQTTLYIPEKMELIAKTMGGHIESTNIEGDQTYETGGGHITLERLAGDVIAISGGGHIQIEDVIGDVTFKTTGGHLKVQNCTGDVILRTEGGNIELEEIEGEIIASTNAGNIAIQLTSFSDDITAETFAGNFQLILPASSEATFDLQASNVVELKNLTFQGDKSKAKAKGNINGGGSEVIAFTKFGKVTIIGKN